MDESDEPPDDCEQQPRDQKAARVDGESDAVGCVDQRGEDVLQEADY